MSLTIDYIKGLLTDVGCVSLAGSCQKCGADVEIVVFRDGMEVEGNGGIIKGFEDDPEFKCSECLARDGGMISPTRCEVYSRVCGYLRPISQWNKGKKAEQAMRTNYAV